MAKLGHIDSVDADLERSFHHATTGPGIKVKYLKVCGETIDQVEGPDSVSSMAMT